MNRVASSPVVPARSALSALWRLVAQPSLSRRLLCSLLGMLTTIWLLCLVLAVYWSLHDDSEFADDARFDMVLSAAQSLASSPELQRRSLEAIDVFQRRHDGPDAVDLRLNMAVSQHGRVVYRSPGSPAAVRNAELNAIEVVSADGKEWRARTRAGEDGWQVTLFRSADEWQVMMVLEAKGLLLLPLLVGLPILVWPAWLSVRLALRPWSRLLDEVVVRGPEDLQALQFRPRHRELVPVVDSVNALLARVREGKARERRFIADAAHELRTPLAALQVHAEALQHHAQAPGQRALLQGLLRSGERAARLVSQLLTLTRSDAGVARTRSLSMVALQGLVEERLAVLALGASARGVELVLVCTRHVRVAGDREGLESLIDNLLDNAIKASPAGAAVVVRLAVREGQAELFVEDQGPGIEPALRDRVFERFFRAPDASQPGSGLGLAIVKAIVEQHGGSVTLEKARADDAAQPGLRVTVRLPLAATEDAPIV